MENLLISGALADNRFDYFRYDLSSPLDQYPIADADVFAVDIIFIVKSSSFDRYSADIYRFKNCEGIEASSPAYIDAYTKQSGSSLNGWELVSDSPSRVVANIAEFFLQSNRINLNDNHDSIIG